MSEKAVTRCVCAAPFRLAHISVILQLTQRQRPEQLLRHGERRELALKETARDQRASGGVRWLVSTASKRALALCAAPEPSAQLAFRGARLPDEQQVLAGERREQQQPDLGAGFRLYLILR